jgi:cysteine desulfurase / selenocysteine lyase
VKDSFSVSLGSRALFPTLQPFAFLNHAAISPVSEPVRQAVTAALTDYAESGVVAFPKWAAQREAVRDDFARLIGAPKSDVALGVSTTRALTDIALSFPWTRGDRVLLFQGEFPANITPWQRAAELFGLELVFHRADDFQSTRGLEQMEAELRRGVRLVAASAVQFQTGLKMPICEMGEICTRYGAAFSVDAVQACGAVPIDAPAACIDFLATSTHKWLLGVEGAGFCYVSPRYQALLRPFTAGWLSHEAGADFLFRGPGLLRYDRPLRTQPEVFEGSTASLLGFAAVGASLKLLLELGVGAIYQHINHYLDSLEPGLLGLGFQSLRSANPALRSTCLCVTHESVSAVELAGRLRKQGVIAGTPDGKLRFSPHFSNNIDEIPGVLAALERAVNNAG